MSAERLIRESQTRSQRSHAHYPVLRMVAVTCLASLLLRLDDGANTCGLEVVSGVIDVKNAQIKIQNVKKRKNVTKIKKRL